MTKRRKLVIFVGVILLVAIMGGAVVYLALNSPNRAQSEAIAALQSDAEVTVWRAEDRGWYEFAPTGRAPDTGFILYPGAFVDPVAYAPIARAIAREGYLVAIPTMPLNLAVADIAAADDVIAAHPEIANWGIGGHSLGGAMAAEYVQNNPNAMVGLALWAAYPAADADLSSLPLTVVSIFGDADGVAAVSDVTGAAGRLPADTRFIAIPGGNHTQFGYYGDGLQRGDDPATIGHDEQMALIVSSTVAMLQTIDAAQ
jgi:dienelactone hydrolase